MLEVLRDAGRDKQRHPLAEVKCSHCGSVKVMRQSNLNRAKSCGCVKAARFKRMVAQRRKKPIKLADSVFSEYDSSTMTPAEICAAVQAKGLFVSSVKPKAKSLNALYSDLR